MVTLTSCEIMDELRKLGISSSQELIQYVLDYTNYYSILDLHIDRLKG